MRFSQENDQHRFYIHAIEGSEVIIAAPNPRAFTVVNQDGHVVVNSSFIITPKSLDVAWQADPSEQLTPDQLSKVTALENLEVVIIGTGAQTNFPSAETLKPLIEAGIGYEVMDSHAACRTYNILCGEGRNVAAAIMLKA